MEHLYIPEYSNELLQLVLNVYSQHVMYQYPKLRLEKFIDLLEKVEYLFESYRDLLQNNHYDDCMTAYSIGGFYIYLIIPNSVQFHTLDKSFSIYVELKKYYQEEYNMKNVLLAVVNIVSSNIFSTYGSREGTDVIPKGNSFEINHQLVELVNNNLSEQSHQLPSSEHVIKWSTPKIEPNEQLKSVLDSNNNVAHKPSSFYSSPTEQNMQSLPNTTFSYSSLGNKKNSSPLDTQTFGMQYLQHDFKDPGNKDNKSHIDSNDISLYMRRLQNNYIITCSSLFDLLRSPERDNILLISLCLREKSTKNHIVAPNLVHIDPILLWDVDKNSTISNISQLVERVNSQLFTDRARFQKIIYYTDNETYMHLKFNYQFEFFRLMYTYSTQIIPICLLGGYNQWELFLCEQMKVQSFNLYDFLYNMNIFPQTNASGYLSRQNMLPHKILTQELPENTEHTNPSKTCSPVNGLSYVDHKSSITNNAHNQRSLTTSTRQIYNLPIINQSSNVFVALSITGLKNMGNTCYINSMIQCLFATKLLRDIFLTSDYQRYLTSNTTHQMSKSFNMLFKKMYMNGGCSVVPSGFLKSCNFLRPDFNISSDQQDTQEFLLFVLDRLHKELSHQDEVANDYPTLLLHNTEKMKVNGKEYNKWFFDNVVKNGLSPIDYIFQGQMENCLECQRCGYSSYSYSTFYVLSLALPSVTTTIFEKTRKIHLEDCINLFTHDEILAGENAWDCPKCISNRNIQEPSPERKKRGLFVSPEKGISAKKTSKLFKFKSKSNNAIHSSTTSLIPDRVDFKRMKAIKTMNFILLPQILVIHLSRFLYDLTEKNKATVTYPLILNIVLKNNEICRYKLYGIVNHFGNLRSGHYTSLVNKDLNHRMGYGGEKWYYFDDEVVKEDIQHKSFENGVTNFSSTDVYVLFYERIYNQY